MIRTDTELRYLPGVGPRKASSLARQGLETVDDLLYLLPRRYEDRRRFARLVDLQPGGPEGTLSVVVDSARLIRTRRRGFTIFEAMVSDDSGTAKAVWYNQSYLTRVLTAGRRVVLFGRIVANRYGKLVLDNADYEPIDDEDGERVHTGRVVPVYRRQGDLGARGLRRLIFTIFEQLDPESLPGSVPEEIAERHGMMSRLDALRQCHFPPDEIELEQLESRATLAQRTLAFEEIFLLQLALALRRQSRRDQARGIAYEVSDAVRTKLSRLLPFKLTSAQKRVLSEIGADLRSPYPMNRLLQGDVGSGKTIVALLTMMVVVENGYQAALMAPTEILAEQHYRTISRMLESLDDPPDCILLTGSQRSAARRATLARIADGSAGLVVGTHALFEQEIQFSALGLAVVDEQHRFGVMQRVALSEKGSRPDVLVMTATPIPRSLALTLYGDLDLSVIDELPPGRTPIRTVVRTEEDRRKVYDGVRREISRGRQAYVVVPLVEETEKSDLKAATAFAEDLRGGLLQGIEVGMLHGRMKGPEKESVMQAFVAGTLKVLVATTVIEVGVDVPNATIMVVEHAERFGLSQLHQLRGRVGRGAQRSYCALMVHEDRHGPEARERLAVMEQTSDGFRIAERDLEIRGPGAVFGTQQHGMTDLQFLSAILKAPALLDAARLEAQALVAGGSAQRARAGRILESLGSRWKRRLDLARVG